MTGIVTHLIIPRGFGCLTPIGSTGEDLFFHFTSLSPELEFTDQLLQRRVEFDEIDDARSGKRRAINLRPAA